MKRYPYPLAATSLLCILLIVPSTLANQWIDLIKTAKHEVKIMAPGLYSSKLIRYFESHPEIKFEIIINPESLHQPKLIIGNLPNNVSLRILDTPDLIPHNIVLLDSQKLLFGGSKLSDKSTLEFAPILINDKTEIQNQTIRFNTVWDSIDVIKSSSSLVEHINTLQEKTISISISQYDNQYVASRKSKIFHKNESPIIKRIKPHNRVYFNSWKEAVESGRKPSKHINRNIR